ncbi:hypothetical protein AB0L53_00360 [Nonomuraea sp. NPDC052129]
MILLPLGQPLSPEGSFVAPAAMVSACEGADLFTEQFSPTA